MILNKLNYQITNHIAQYDITQINIFTDLSIHTYLSVSSVILMIIAMTVMMMIMVIITFR